MYEVIKEYKLGNISIMGSDLENKFKYISMAKMDYKTAIILIEAMQNKGGWRFPTLKEFSFLRIFYENKLLNFSNDAYWTNNSIEESVSYGGTSLYHYGYYFNGPSYGGIPKTERLCVRLVRDI